MEPGLEAVDYYDPPNMTYPFGAYLCVVDIDRMTGEAKVRRFYALDDCGTRINPMVIEGQVHGGLTEAFGIAMGQEIVYDAMGNVQNASLHGLSSCRPRSRPRNGRPTSPSRPSPHHPIGAKGVGESPNVGGVSAFSNAVIDAFAHLGVTHMPMPHTPSKIWKVCQSLGIGKWSRSRPRRSPHRRKRVRAQRGG